MTNNLKKILLLGFFSCSLIAGSYSYASNYYSSQTPGTSGYYSSSSMGGGYYSASPRPQGQNFSVAMNMPAYMGYMGSSTSYHAHAQVYPGQIPQHIWVDASTGSPLPHHTIIGGEEPGSKEVLYICRANYLGGTHPGKLHYGKCTFTYHGNEIRTDQYQVLVGQGPLHWLPSSFGNIPTSAIAAGDESGSLLYICQVNYKDGRIPGKLIGQDCHVGHEGRVFTSPYYQILSA